MATTIPSLASYSLLGTSGLRVSPLCLGTMTFGTEWGWGVPPETAHAMLDRFVDSGGNVIDTADLYTNGSSERIVGAWLHERKQRERVVLATKFTFNMDRTANPNAGGNGRKNILRAVDASLGRLGTDYIDLYWLHCWDQVTPVEEVLATLDSLVRAGKVRAVGLSDVPAWYAARAVTLAGERGLERPCALQLEYSLIERSIEHEHVPLARELGLGITPWSPLAAGLLTGKHKRGAGETKVEGEGRLKVVEKSTAPAWLRLFRERNWQIADVVVDVAREIGCTPAQAALSFIARRPGVQSTIVGATSVAQLDDNLKALEVKIPPALWQRLDDVSRLEPAHPYAMYDAGNAKMINGGTSVTKKPEWY